jgi:hypothetical protein
LAVSLGDTQVPQSPRGVEMMAKGTYGAILLATADLGGAPHPGAALSHQRQRIVTS